jgi:hypothetical protein
VCIVRKLLRRFDAYTLVALNPIPTRLRAGGPDRPVSPRVGRFGRLGRFGGGDGSGRAGGGDGGGRFGRAGGGEQRRSRRRLAAELAEYRTPAERLELDLILSRHTAEQIREIEDLLPRRAD